jgi:hypothetical protein
MAEGREDEVQIDNGSDVSLDSASGSPWHERWLAWHNWVFVALIGILMLVIGSIGTLAAIGSYEIAIEGARDADRQATATEQTLALIQRLVTNSDRTLRAFERIPATLDGTLGRVDAIETRVAALENNHQNNATNASGRSAPTSIDTLIERLASIEPRSPMRQNAAFEGDPCNPDGKDFLKALQDNLTEAARDMTRPDPSAKPDEPTLACARSYFAAPLRRT